MLAGGASPWRFVSSSFGSKVSTWLAPPFMKREITARAFAGKCGCFGASGETGASAAISPSRARMSQSARPAMPPPLRNSNSRREIQVFRFSGYISVHVNKYVGVDQRVAEIDQRRFFRRRNFGRSGSLLQQLSISLLVIRLLGLNEVFCSAQFARFGRAAEREEKSAIDLRR